MGDGRRQRERCHTRRGWYLRYGRWWHRTARVWRPLGAPDSRTSMGPSDSGAGFAVGATVVTVEN